MRKHPGLCFFEHGLGRPLSIVIAGLDPAIHEHSPQTHLVRMPSPHHLMDARVKPGHDSGVCGNGGARYTTFSNASRASHGCHHSFSPRSRAITPALI